MLENLDLAAAPLLCAGITTYSPLMHWKVCACQKVGMIGLGGLGHMGVKLAHATGRADDILLSNDAEAMKVAMNSFDFLLNTIPVGQDTEPYMNLLKRDCSMVVVGSVEPLKVVNGATLIFKRRHLAGSLIGGIQETQEMFDFCGKHNITCDIETISAIVINTAYDRTVKGDVKYRFVIDIATLESA